MTGRVASVTDRVYYITMKIDTTQTTAGQYAELLFKVSGKIATLWIIAQIVAVIG